jgi:lysophospholipase L1-like esterase
MIGDSLTVGATPVLKEVFAQLGFSAIAINAEKSRRIEASEGKVGPRAGIDVAKYVVGSRPRPQVWVIALGTNDAGQYKDAAEYRGVIDKLLAIIPADVPLAWIDNYRGDHLPGSVLFNQELRAALDKRGHAVVGDWYRECLKPDAAILGLDEVHPNKRGVLVFAATVRTAVQTLVKSVTSS